MKYTVKRGWLRWYVYNSHGDRIPFFGFFWKVNAEILASELAITWFDGWNRGWDDLAEKSGVKL